MGWHARQMGNQLRSPCSFVASPCHRPRPRHWRHVVDYRTVPIVVSSSSSSHHPGWPRPRDCSIVAIVLITLAIVSRPRRPSRQVIDTAVAVITPLVFATTRQGLVASIRACMNTMVVKEKPLVSQRGGSGQQRAMSD